MAPIWYRFPKLGIAWAVAAIAKAQSCQLTNGTGADGIVPMAGGIKVVLP